MHRSNLWCHLEEHSESRIVLQESVPGLQQLDWRSVVQMGSVRCAGLLSLAGCAGSVVLVMDCQQTRRGSASLGTNVVLHVRTVTAGGRALVQGTVERCWVLQSSAATWGEHRQYQQDHLIKSQVGSDGQDMQHNSWCSFTYTTSYLMFLWRWYEDCDVVLPVMCTDVSD